MVIVLTSFGPVVSSTALAENKVVGAEKATEGSRADRVHSTGLEIDEDGTGNVFVGTDLVIVHRNTLELKVVVALVETVTLDTVLVRNNLPEFGTLKENRNLVNTRVIRIGLRDIDTHQSGYRTIVRDDAVSDVDDGYHKEPYLASLEVDNFTHAVDWSVSDPNNNNRKWNDKETRQKSRVSKVLRQNLGDGAQRGDIQNGRCTHVGN